MRKHTPPVPSTPFMNVRDAARATGLSEYYLRKELDKGTIPHLKSGRYLKGKVMTRKYENWTECLGMLRIFTR